MTPFESTLIITLTLFGCITTVVAIDKSLLIKPWTRLKEIAFMYVLSTTFNRENMRVAQGTRWSIGCLFNADGGISIGKNVLIGPHVIIHSSNHNYNDPDKPINQQGHTRKPVVIEDDCWIGANAVILAGVHLGYGCVVGAGSVVTHSIPAYCIAVGNPAHIIKVRGGKQTLRFRDIIRNYLDEDRIKDDELTELLKKEKIAVYN
jgi:acetyltransferase-like isoleucine patch superfamily enzyme